MIIKTRHDGRVLGPEQLGCYGHRLDQVGCGPIVREPMVGRVVRGPSIQLQQRVQSLGERYWIARSHGEGRVLPHEWLIDPAERPTMMAQTRQPDHFEISIERPQPNRAA